MDRWLSILGTGLFLFFQTEVLLPEARLRAAGDTPETVVTDPAEDSVAEPQAEISRDPEGKAGLEEGNFEGFETATAEAGEPGIQETGTLGSGDEGEDSSAGEVEADARGAAGEGSEEASADVALPRWRLPIEEGTTHSVYVIPVEGQISKPIEYIIRRGIKQAIENDVDVVVLDIDTPGGALDVTLKIMKMLDRFEGHTFAYVNDEAISAGAFISAAADRIFFTSVGVIGAAAPVMATGGEIDPTMLQKVLSYLKARVRTYTDEHPYRGEVLAAMMDAEYELVIEGEVIKKSGELLTLTAKEAMKTYGNPPQPLLGAGIYESLDELLDTVASADGYSIQKFEVTWSESLAQYLSVISPILMGLGILGLIIEFKTPGFGIIGIAGISLLLVVFASNYVAGLAGHEPLLVFVLGVILIGVELFVLPGTVIPGLAGVLLILGSLVFSMADWWPGEGFSFDPRILLPPLYNLSLSLVIAAGSVALLWRYLPNSWLIDHIVLKGSVGGPDPVAAGGGSSLNRDSSLPTVGTRGVAVTDLHPGGEIDIEGKRYQASVDVGSVGRGSEVKVSGYRSFTLLVDRVDS